MNNIFKSFLFILAFALIGCSSKPDNAKKGENKITEERQLNICILLDLSDRIEPKKNDLNPSQAERDIQAILSVVEIFKNNMAEKGVFNSKDKINVLFHPQPNTEDLATLVENLTVKLNGLESQEKKKIYDEIENNFRNNLKSLYSKATQKKEFEGADIWHFMKNDISDKCLEESPIYRNILLILTDGYMYWPYNKIKDENRYNYITGAVNHFKQFRDNKLLKTKFEENDYGFIPVKNDLGNLEIMVIGINPPKVYPQDYDIIRKYWSKWFKEMNVANFKILKTDLPTYTTDEIESFFND